MASDADEQAMREALGFSSFGAGPKPRKRVRRTPPPSSRPLAQLMPGTELRNSSLSSTDRGPHGILYLVKPAPYGFQTLQQALKERPEGASISCKPLDDRFEAEQHTAELLSRLQAAKTRFDTLNSTQFLAARHACNAFERLGRHRFVNRSAMKLATLDFVFGWTAAASKRPGTFSFADICGGPGGFSELLLWRLQRPVHRFEASQGTTDVAKSVEHQRSVDGLGITLKDAENHCDWRLPPHLAQLITDDDQEEEEEGGSLATFTVCYGADGTGDVYSLANIRRFRDVVLARQPSGVALVVADGGFPDARDLDNQEAVMTRLVMAETLAMFNVLEPGGDFVCKTFELATSAMRQLLWLLHQCFEQLAIVKPITSRPASSERYVVARGLHSGLPLPDIATRLETIVAGADTSDKTPVLLPNLDFFDEDDAFHQFMATANDTFAVAQTAACELIMEFAQAPADKQAKIQEEQRRSVTPAEYYTCWQLDDV